jgi:Holliday junction resolvase RusA-like endonuclease
MYKLEFEIPTLPAMTNAKQKHWRIVRKEETMMKTLVAFSVPMDQRPTCPLKQAALVLTRFSSKAPDPDGLVSGFKNVIDGLVEIGVLEDDSYEHIGMPHYRWEKVKKGEGKIRVQVFELEEHEHA